jgi:arylsulfatase A-like enzyme
MTDERPNILLVVLDIVRTENTSMFFTGQCNDTTPELHALTEQATQYKNAIAPGTASLQSHMSIFTGLEVA